MRPRILLGGLLASGSLAASVPGTNLGRTDEPPRVVRMDISRNRVNTVENHRIRRRQTVPSVLENMETLYFISVAVGTPPQELRLHLDTGSSDMWVNTPDSDLCSMTRGFCSAGGTYESRYSETYSLVGDHFNISYVDRTGASGDYVTDTLHLGTNVSLSDFQFGVGKVSSSSRGILGIGYPSNEVQVARSGMDPYDNLPAKLAADGHIQSSAYSIYLNEFDSEWGTILFGGVDRSHFEGELATLPVQAEDGEYSRLLVTLTKLEFDSKVVAEDMALAVLLDTGSSITYLPDAIASSLFDRVNATYDDDRELAFVPCDARNRTEKLVFTFTEPSIAVPMDELVLDLDAVTGRNIQFKDGGKACLFGVAPAGKGSNVLGDTFLRSAYAVFDLENNEVSLAQARMDSEGGDILEIKAGKDGVPGARKVKGSVDATTGLDNGDQDDDESGAPGRDHGLVSLTAGLLAILMAVAMYGV